MALLHAPADNRRVIGFGMLGSGLMAKAHCNALRTVPYIFWPSAARPELVAISARSESRLRDAATRYGFQSYTTDWRDLMADRRVEIFDNVAADSAHVEPTLAAIEAGKHVVCEKPLASNAQDAFRLYEAASQKGVKNLVCFNYRFFPAVRTAWELLHQGDLGEPYQARFRYSQEWRTDPNAALPSPTGVTDIICSHAFDQARFLLGEILAVSAAIRSPVTTPERLFEGEPAQQDDTVAVLAEIEGGLVATIDASLVSPGRRNHLAWEVNGSKGSLAWDLEEPNVLRVHVRGRGAVSGFTNVITCEREHVLARPWWPSGHVLGWEHGHINMLAHFLDAVAGVTDVEPFGATFADGLRVAQIAEAVHEAATTGNRTPVAKMIIANARS